MSWTQPLCERCWIDQHAVPRADGGWEVRKPTRVIEPDIEICCQCGNLTIVGIYVRRDPATVPYPGKDEP